MPDLLQAVQDALFAALNVSSVTSKAPVYQHPPNEAQPPLIVIGDISSTPWDHKDEDVEDVLVEIETYFRGPRRAGLLAIQGAVRDALRGKALSATGVILSPARWISQDAPNANPEDGITYAGLLTFMVTAQPAD
jgi:hypothetical protein